MLRLTKNEFRKLMIEFPYCGAGPGSHGRRDIIFLKAELSNKIHIFLNYIHQRIEVSAGCTLFFLAGMEIGTAAK
jgi:hypothetical protein